MKSIRLSLVSALVILACFETAHADPNIAACQGVFKACQAAGFKVGAHKKGDKEGADSGLWVDCIDAVADGKKSVAGVNPTDAQACKAAVKAKRAEKTEKH